MIQAMQLSREVKKGYGPRGKLINDPPFLGFGGLLPESWNPEHEIVRFCQHRPPNLKKSPTSLHAFIFLQ
jgi:hypothetical protein